MTATAVTGILSPKQNGPRRERTPKRTTGRWSAAGRTRGTSAIDTWPETLDRLTAHHGPRAKGDRLGTQHPHRATARYTDMAADGIYGYGECRPARPRVSSRKTGGGCWSGLAPTAGGGDRREGVGGRPMERMRVPRPREGKNSWEDLIHRALDGDGFAALRRRARPRSCGALARAIAPIGVVYRPQHEAIWQLRPEASFRGRYYDAFFCFIGPVAAVTAAPTWPSARKTARCRKTFPTGVLTVRKGAGHDLPRTAGMPAVNWPPRPDRNYAGPRRRRRCWPSRGGGVWPVGYEVAPPPCTRRSTCFLVRKLGVPGREELGDGGGSHPAASAC